MIVATLADVVDLYAARGGATYGEDVTQVDHAVQSAAAATARAAPPAVVAAALLHDIGHLLAPDGDGADDHAAVGARALGRLFGPDVCTPIALHVAAKRYLCATDGAYWAGLSRASQRSLHRQGGAFDPPAARRFIALQHAPAAVIVRRCDDGGKRVGPALGKMSDFLPLLTRLARLPSG